MPSSLSSASLVTGQIYLEEQNVAGGEEEKDWVFASESDNVVILVPYQVKTQSAKRAMSASKEQWIGVESPSFTIRAWGIQGLLRHHLLPSWSLG